LRVSRLRHRDYHFTLLGEREMTEYEDYGNS
jgi:hypothetical protein